MKFNLLLFFLSVFMHANGQVTANAGSDQLVCIGDTLKVTGKGLNSGDTGTYQWKDLTTNGVISTNAFFSVKISSLTSKKYELQVTRFHNNVNYSGKDTFVMTVSPLPTFKFAGLTSMCFMDGCLNLTFNIVASAAQGNDTSKRFYDIPYFQKYKKPSWISGGPSGSAPYLYCPGKHITNGQIPKGGLIDTICYEYKDKNGCYNSECKPIKLNPNPDVQVNNGVFCQRNGCIGLDKLAIIPFNKAGGIQNWRCLKVPAGSGVNPNAIITTISSTPNTYCLDPGLPGENKKTGDYTVEYCFKNPSTGCQKCDTSTITVVRLPEIEFNTIPSQCINGNLLIMDSFVYEKFSGKRLSNTKWECVEFGGSRDKLNSQVNNAINNSVKSQKYFDPKTGSGQYLLRVTDLSSGCGVTDSVSVNVNGLPQIKLPAPDSVCANSGNYQLYSNYAVNDSNGKWSGEFVSNNRLNSDLVVMGSSYSRKTNAKFTYTSPLTKCTNIDSQYFTFIKRPYFKFVQVVTKNSQFLVSFYLTDSNMMIKNFDWSWDFGNGAMSNDKYPKEILYMDSGNYKVFLTINNGVCNTTDSISFVLNAKASSVNNIYKIVNVYPNPVTSEMFINAPISGILNIYDTNGKMIINEVIESGMTKRLDADKLSSGLYLLTISNTQNIYRLKFIKQ